MTIPLEPACHGLMRPISLDHRAGVGHRRAANRHGAAVACATLVGWGLLPNGSGGAFSG
jgi:hypothetical protein